jgi:hypothetical protein
MTRSLAALLLAIGALASAPSASAAPAGPSSCMGLTSVFYAQGEGRDFFAHFVTAQFDVPGRDLYRGTAQVKQANCG